MLMTYESTAGISNVGYRILNDDKTVDTALTTTGVTEMTSGGYGVDIADSKAGKTIQWYEGSVYSVSERIPSFAEVSMSANALAGAVWDEPIASHLISGSAGQFLSRVYRYFFGKRVATNSQIQVYAHDGTDVDATMSVSGDGSTLTKDAAS